jgi:shikimate dehydrogenase
MADYLIIINCTPLGTSPNTAEFPEIPYEFLGAQHIAFDLIYNPEETLFLSKAKAQGAVIKNGFEMLLLQADASWKIWKK